jgi:hypothetical protein
MTELFVVDGSSLSAMQKSLATLAELIAEEDDPAPPAAVFDPPVSCNTTPLPTSRPVVDDRPSPPALRLAADAHLRRWEFFRKHPNAEELLSKALLRAWVGDPREADELYAEMIRLTSPPRLLLRGLGPHWRPSSEPISYLDDEAEAEELYSRHRAP